MTEATAALMGDNGGTDSGAAPQGAAAQPSPWSAGFDEDTTAYVTNKGWQSPGDLLASYRNLEKFAGGSKNLLELPGVDADPKAWDSVFSKLGRPESPDGYGLKAEGANPELMGWFKQAAHEAGLSDKQAAKLFEGYNGLSGSMQEKMQAQMAQTSEREITQLKQEWGQAFDKQIAMGKHAVAALGMDEAKLSQYESKLGTAEMLKLFATLGSKMGEDSFESGERSGSSFGTTPAAARQQIADLKTNNDFMSKYLSGDRDAVGKMKRLMEAAHVG